MTSNDPLLASSAASSVGAPQTVGAAFAPAGKKTSANALGQGWPRVDSFSRCSANAVRNDASYEGALSSAAGATACDRIAAASGENAHPRSCLCARPPSPRSGSARASASCQHSKASTSAIGPYVRDGVAITARSAAAFLTTSYNGDLGSAPRASSPTSFFTTGRGGAETGGRGATATHVFVAAKSSKASAAQAAAARRRPGRSNDAKYAHGPPRLPETASLLHPAHFSHRRGFGGTGGSVGSFSSSSSTTFLRRRFFGSGGGSGAGTHSGRVQDAACVTVL
mmetsp:Transcript_11313/g.34128  ORF Transcript_11313/g.34128 Transcript_11313/m.34128 type:complete len:282 (+) Transcript_11313:703-1548(+)